MLEEGLSPEDRAILGSRTPHVHPSLPGVVVVPGSGPNRLDYNTGMLCAYLRA